MSGYVYFASYPPGFLKVGISRHPAKRIKIMSRKFPHRLPSEVDLSSPSMIGVIAGTYADEQAFHRILEPFMVSGCKEWFHDNAASRCVISGIGLAPAPEEPINVQLDADSHATLKQWCEDRNYTLRVGIRKAVEKLTK